MTDPSETLDSKDLLALLFSQQAKVLGYDCKCEKGSEQSVIYHGSANETEKKLVLLKVKELLSSTTNLATSEITIQNNAQESARLDNAMQSDCLLKLTDVQGLEPRGRFTITLTPFSLLVEGKIASTVINWDNISYFIVVPNHVSTKKDGEKCFVLIFKEPTIFSGKPIKHLLLNLFCDPTKSQIANGQTKSEVDLFLGQVAENFPQIKVQTVDSSIFQSSMQNKSFLRCYKGTQEGALYPLSCGLLFVKPMQFTPSDQIASLTAGRGGGGGSTKFIDVNVGCSCIYLLFSLSLI